MKKYITLLLLLIVSEYSFGQILPGTLEVSGFPSMSQAVSDLVQEAGADDNTVGFESDFDEALVSFILDPTDSPMTGITTSEENCTENIYRYKVYMHTINPPQNVIIEAKTTFDSGIGYPASIPYDNLSVQPLGPRGLTPENGGAYLPIPNQGDIAIKVFEFVGCRQDIPIQFRIRASSHAISGNSNFNIFYTIVGSLN